MQRVRRMCLLLTVFILGMVTGTFGKSVVIIVSGSLFILWFCFYESRSYERFELKNKIKEASNNWNPF